MATVVQFRRKQHSKWAARIKWAAHIGLPRFSLPLLAIAALIVAGNILEKTDLSDEPARIASSAFDLRCQNPRVIDGDTIHCNGERVRLTNIDAPELPGHCSQGRRCVSGNPDRARDMLTRLTRGVVVCRSAGRDRYGRVLATCESAGRDLSCAMVESGNAIERYGRLNC